MIGTLSLWVRGGSAQCRSTSRRRLPRYWACTSPLATSVASHGSCGRSAAARPGIRPPWRETLDRYKCCQMPSAVSSARGRPRIAVHPFYLLRMVAHGIRKCIVMLIPREPRRALPYEHLVVRWLLLKTTHCCRTGEPVPERVCRQWHGEPAGRRPRGAQCKICCDRPASDVLRGRAGGPVVI